MENTANDNLKNTLKLRHIIKLFENFISFFLVTYVYQYNLRIISH